YLLAPTLRVGPHLPRSAGRSVDSGLRIGLWWSRSALDGTPVGRLCERPPPLPSSLPPLPVTARLQRSVMCTRLDAARILTTRSPHQLLQPSPPLTTTARIPAGSVNLYAFRSVDRERGKVIRHLRPRKAEGIVPVEHAAGARFRRPGEGARHAAAGV